MHAVPATVLGCEIQVLWDSFTHKTGWMVSHVPALRVNLSPVTEHPFELFRILPYGSSRIGLAFLFCVRASMDHWDAVFEGISATMAK